MASASWDLYLVPGTARTQAGENIHIDFKAYRYEAGEVFWELKRVFAPVLGLEKSEKAQLCRIHKANRVSWEHDFEKFFGQVDGVLLPSLTSCKASGQHDPADNPFIRQEYTISTAGLLAVLLNMAQARKLVVERERAFAVLVAWLSSTLAFEPAAAVCRDAMPVSAHLCQQQPVVDGFCTHIFATRVQCPQAVTMGSDPWSKLALLLKQLHAWSSECWASTAALSSILKTLSADLDGGLGGRDFSQNILMDKSADGHRGAQGQKKRRRLDEDLKRLATVDSVVQGRVHSGSQLCRATGCADDSAARKWETTFLAKVVASSVQAFSEVRSLCVTEDASRFGQPQKDLMAYLAWSGDINVGTALPPQAPPNWLVLPDACSCLMVKLCKRYQ